MGLNHSGLVMKTYILSKTNLQKVMNRLKSSILETNPCNHFKVFFLHFTLLAGHSAFAHLLNDHLVKSTHKVIHKRTLSFLHGVLLSWLNNNVTRGPWATSLNCLNQHYVRSWCYFEYTSKLPLLTI